MGRVLRDKQREQSPEIICLICGEDMSAESEEARILHVIWEHPLAFLSDKRVMSRLAHAAKTLGEKSALKMRSSGA